MRRHAEKPLIRWVVLSVVFLTFGGIGAGLTAILFELVTGEPFSDALYAVIYGGCGFIAYRQAQYLFKRHRSHQ